MAEYEGTFFEEDSANYWIIQSQWNSDRQIHKCV